jgi:hypothetical protein
MSSTAEDTGIDIPVETVVAFCPLGVTFDDESSGWPAAALEGLRRSARWDAASVEDHLPVLYVATEQDALVELMDSFPRALLTYDVDPSELSELGLPRQDSDQLCAPMRGWVLSDVRVSVWNVGSALAVLTYDVPREPATGEAWLRESVSAVKGLESSIQRLMTVLTGWTRATFGALWVTPFYICAAGSGAGYLERHEIASLIAVNGTDVIMEEYPETAVRLARFSCIVTDDTSNPAVPLTLGLLSTHHVCWSAALILDATLNRELESVGLEDRLVPEALERQATRVLNAYLRVRKFRLGYGSVEAHLDTAAARLWKGVEEAWRFERVLQSVDERLDFVSTLHGQLQARLQDGRARLLNEIVLIFTFFNLFSIAIAALTFAGLPTIFARIAPISAMALLLGVNIAAYAWFKRRYNAPPSDPKRHR